MVFYIVFGLAGIGAHALLSEEPTICLAADHCYNLQMMTKFTGSLTLWFGVIKIRNLGSRV